MKMKSNKLFYTGIVLIAVFVLWTVLVRVIDVQTIGPQESSVGFATLNKYVHNLIGVHFSLYTITDWLGLIPIGVAFGFGVLGLIQWMKRKSLVKVDMDILILGGFYMVVMMVYILFEVVVINYRPVLINGYLEPSYPSSTTMLVACIMPTAMIQFHARIQNKIFRRVAIFTSGIFTVFMIIGRLVSGVHWTSDIIGGILISAGLVLSYYSISRPKSLH